MEDSEQESSGKPKDEEPSDVIAEVDAIEPNANSEEEEHDPSPHVRITDALQNLPMFDDLFLKMQAMNLEIVDSYIEDLEMDLLREYIEIERTPVQSALFVSALSQLWVFGLYELLRTWRQRAAEVLKFAAEVDQLAGPKREESIAKQKERIANASEAALDRMYYWEPFERIVEDPKYKDGLRGAFDQTETLFRRIEALRISLAKHEVPKSKGAFAMAPGYGRIDMSTGSIYWQIVLQGNQVDLVSRRTLADECRRIGEDHSDRILPAHIQEKVLQLPREAYGITRVAVKLEDGSEFPEVIVSWGKEVVWVKGKHSRIPFNAAKVVEVRSVPAPAASPASGEDIRA